MTYSVIDKYSSKRKTHADNSNGRYIVMLSPNYRDGVDLIVLSNDDTKHAVWLDPTKLTLQMHTDEEFDILVKSVDIHVERMIKKMDKGQSIDFKKLADILTDDYCSDLYNRQKQSEVTD